MNRTIIEFVAHNATNITIQIENQLATAPIDPNWFYSAVAQSSAAIVGLMGAFLTTKLINQKIIITQLKNEIKDYELEIKKINGELIFDPYTFIYNSKLIPKDKSKQIGINYYERKIKEKKNQLKNNQDFDYLKLNYLTLGLFSVLGVFLPLAIMLLGYNAMLSLRPIVFIFMSVGWIAILAYVGYEIQELFNMSKIKSR